MNTNTEITYTIKVSPRKPITIWYNGRGIVPLRQVIYRTPSHCQIVDPTTQYATVSYHGNKIIIYRNRKDSLAQWGEWSALRLIEPYVLPLIEVSASNQNKQGKE